MTGHLLLLSAVTIQVALAAVRCRSDQFACDNGEQCINDYLFCNGFIDCGDDSDEIRYNNSEVQAGIPCRQFRVRIYEYVCMLPERYLSRKDNFCKISAECDENQFACFDGSACLALYAYCNGDNVKCNDNSDQIRRNNSEVQNGIPCRIGTNVCMLPERFLSRKDDLCIENPECDENEFVCSDGSGCLPMYYFCSGIADCNDNSDEIRRINSEVQTGIPCRHNQYVCMLPESYLSKKNYFCTKNTECDENEFACSDGSACLDMNCFCDGYKECNDNSDEIRRTNSEVQNGIPCRRYANVCMLPERYLSKKNNFCAENTDCGDDEFACSDGSACLDKYRFCNDFEDCKDGSDEITRNYSLPQQHGVPCRPDIYICMLPYNQASKKTLLCTENHECEEDEFLCADGSKCIPLYGFCNDYKDCGDGSDEIKASSSDSGIRCRLDNRVCILPDQLLAEKEKFCKKDVNCEDYEFRCEDGNQCLSGSDFCDGFEDCDDGSDEVRRDLIIYSIQPGTPCRRDSGICMFPEEGNLAQKKSICKKNVDCDKDEFSCMDGSACIAPNKFCDGFSHCIDGSDEVLFKMDSPVSGFRCPRKNFICVLPISQGDKQDTICLKKAKCGANQFTCLDGSGCLPKKQFCDNTVHCSDKSDEIKSFHPDANVTGIICRQTRFACLLHDNETSKEPNICKKQPECGPSEFGCSDNLQCLAKYKFCDGVVDCRDGSDEMKRNHNEDTDFDAVPCRRNNNVCWLPKAQQAKQRALCSKVARCKKYEFACSDGTVCLPLAVFCNATVECLDGSDEMKEGSDNPAAVGGSPCRQDRYKCILAESQKNKQTEICQRKFECDENEFGCLDNTQCIPSWWFCDGYADCYDGSDEMGVGSATDGLACRRDRHVCLLPQNQMSKKVNFCRKPV